MELYFLGTGAGMPSRRRNVSSVALTLYDERGSFWLFDCGEGTQQQMLQSPLKPGRLEKLFITHLHGDHCYGLPGLLTSRSYQGGDSPLTLYGPRGIREWIEVTLRISQARLSYELFVVEIEEEGTIFEDAQFKVSVRRLDHRVESYGFRIEEKETPGALDAEALARIGVRPGPMFRQLKEGVDVTLPDGRLLRAAEFVGPSVPGRIITILGDTKTCTGALELSSGADVLVHEATFSGDMAKMAEDYDHSTSLQAAETAKMEGVGTLILTHISSRYQSGDGDELLLEEARTVFQATQMAEDFWSYPIPRKKQLS